jgi:hypothetical protein
MNEGQIFISCAILIFVYCLGFRMADKGDKETFILSFSLGVLVALIMSISFVNMLVPYFIG